MYYVPGTVLRILYYFINPYTYHCEAATLFSSFYQ